MPFGFGALKSLASNAISAATNVAESAAKVAESAATAAASTASYRAHRPSEEIETFEKSPKSQGSS